jgi:hypothetical protein
MPIIIAEEVLRMGEITPIPETVLIPEMVSQAETLTLEMAVTVL